MCSAVRQHVMRAQTQEQSARNFQRVLQESGVGTRSFLKNEYHDGFNGFNTWLEKRGIRSRYCCKRWRYFVGSTKGDARVLAVVLRAECTCTWSRTVKKGNSRKGRVKSTKTARCALPTLLALRALPDIAEFQCIVCKVFIKSPIEMHQHLSFSHTLQELSLAIIGMQALESIHKFSVKIAAPSKPKPENMVVDLARDICKHETLSPIFRPDQSQPEYAEVQEEPMCLKVAIPKSVLKTNKSNAKSPGQDLKTHLQAKISSSKNPRPALVSTKKNITAPSGRQKRKKEIPILPAISKNEEDKIQPGVATIVVQEKTSQDGIAMIHVSQMICNNISEKVLTSHNDNGNHLADKTFSVQKEGSVPSHNEPTCHKLFQTNLSHSIKVDNQVKKKVVFQNPEAIFKKPVDVSKSKETFKRPELTIEKIDTKFKKPESVLMKPAVTIKKLPKCNKKPEVVKPKEQISGSQRTGSFTKNLNNLCNEMQNVCLKRPRSKTPSRKEPPFEVFLEPPLKNSEPEVMKLDSVLKRPVTEDQPLPKKLKSLPQIPPEEIRDEAALTTKSLPVIEVGDDAWYETVKNKLYLESELPTDITNIAMQDFSNQSFEVPKNASKNFNYNDLSNEAFMNLDSYLMPPEIQPQEELNSSQGFVNNNLSFQNSSQVPRFDYSNADLLFENNQNQISSVDLNENMWNSDGNPVYTELLPVYYS